MSEAVKRYWLESFIDDFYKARQFVLAADHDRIVAALTEAGVEMQAERDRLAERCRELEAEKRLLVANELEFGKVAEKSVATIDALRAEVERLTDCLQKANEQAEHFEREWYLCGDIIDQMTANLEIREEERKSLCGMIDGQNVRIAQHLEQIERLRLELERRSGPGADLKDGSDVQS